MVQKALRDTLVWVMRGHQRSAAPCWPKRVQSFELVFIPLFVDPVLGFRSLSLWQCALRHQSDDCRLIKACLTLQHSCTIVQFFTSFSCCVSICNLFFWGVGSHLATKLPFLPASTALILSLAATPPHPSEKDTARCCHPPVVMATGWCHDSYTGGPDGRTAIRYCDISSCRQQSKGEEEEKEEESCLSLSLCQFSFLCLLKVSFSRRCQMQN